MPLSLIQFAYAGLAKVYFGGSSSAIRRALEGRCQRLLDYIEAATKPDDPDLPGNGFKQTGSVYSLDVNGTYRINFQWRDGKPADIDYV